MRSLRPEKISRYLISIETVDTTQKYFRQVGRKGKEAIGYWTGTFSGDDAYVSNVLFPNKFVKNRLDSWGYVKVELNVAFRIGQEIYKLEQFLLIQLHTHPGIAFHSYTDDRYPISHKIGFISIVIPHFAKYPMSDLSTWKVYEYQGTANWRELDETEISQRFILCDKESR